MSSGNRRGDRSGECDCLPGTGRIQAAGQDGGRGSGVHRLRESRRSAGGKIRITPIDRGNTVRSGVQSRRGKSSGIAGQYGRANLHTIIEETDVTCSCAGDRILHGCSECHTLTENGRIRATGQNGGSGSGVHRLRESRRSAGGKIGITAIDRGNTVRSGAQARGRKSGDIAGEYGRADLHAAIEEINAACLCAADGVLHGCSERYALAVTGRVQAGGDKIGRGRARNGLRQGTRCTGREGGITAISSRDGVCANGEGADG